MPPPRVPPSTASLLAETSSDRLPSLFTRASDISSDGKYLHWEDLHRRTPPEGLSRDEWWISLKIRRTATRALLPFDDKCGRPCWYTDSGELHRRLRTIDRDASGKLGARFGDGADHLTGERFLISSLMGEAITSSQLEGARTMRRVASDMLRSGRSPRDQDERMIANNYAAMMFMRGNVDKPLTLSTLLDLQRTLTEGTLDERDVGRLRQSDDVVIEDRRDGTVIHRPPPAAELTVRLGRLVDFANAEDGDVHPFVRAVVLHYMVGYDHPFVDGNGRTARALFYWSMARSGYWLTEYLSVSEIILRAPAQYVRAYLYSETDENDLTYFIDFNLRVMLRAIQALHLYIARKQREDAALFQKLRSDEFAQGFNHRQVALLGHCLRHPEHVYDIASHQRSHGVSYLTARADLSGLAERGLLEVRRQGRRLVYWRSPAFEGRLGDGGGHTSKSNGRKGG